MSTSNCSRILLFGDLIRHVMLEPETALGGRFVGHLRKATNPLLPEMIREALSELRKEDGESARAAPDEPGWEILPTLKDMPEDTWGFGEVHSVLDSFPRKSTSDDHEMKVLRVKTEQLAMRTLLSGDETQTSGAREAKNYLASVIIEVRSALDQESGDPHRRIGVLYDHNARFRDLVKDLGNSLNGDLKKIFAECRGGVVLAINDNIEVEWLNKACELMASQKRTVGGNASDNERRLVIVSADALRKSGLRIMELGALENSVNDVVGQLEKSPLDTLKSHFNDIVVVFRETGGLHIDYKAGRASLTYAPNFDRHAQMHPAKYGGVSGKFTIMLTAIIRELYRASIAAEADSAWDIAAALRLGVAAYNIHFREGFSDNKDFDINTPIDAFKQSLGPKRREHMKECTKHNSKKSDDLLATLNLTLSDAQKKKWCRYDDLFKVKGEKLTDAGEIDVLTSWVTRGLEQGLRAPPETTEDSGFWCPTSVIRVPYTEFGKLRMVEFEEIEKYNSLAKLIDKYLSTAPWKTPLSIAVFGEPGSGKGYAVKQVLKRVSPDRETEPLTFNMAQFDSVDQLTEAFHKVQDRALASQEVPLVIFDEFDSTLNTEDWGWLKYFLAPMQDGLFRGKTEDYRVGRAIFLFAGGISRSFEQFAGLKQERDKEQNKKEQTEQNKKEQTKQEEAEQERDKQQKRERAKLPDFVSRLRGYLDVSGINFPKNANLTSEDKLPIRLRRAIVLRSLLEDIAKPIMKRVDGLTIASIDPNLVCAFLCATHYKHGVRSMEAIIQMSRFIDDRFVPASLPSKDQLEAHVDQESFLRELSGKLRA